jgi:hypothetical protein
MMVPDRMLSHLIPGTQFTCHLMGAQLIFFYPWFVTACALAASGYQPHVGTRYRFRFVFASSPITLYRCSHENSHMSFHPK